MRENDSPGAVRRFRPLSQTQGTSELPRDVWDMHVDHDHRYDHVTVTTQLGPACGDLVFARNDACRSRGALTRKVFVKVYGKVSVKVFVKVVAKVVVKGGR